MRLLIIKSIIILSVNPVFPQDDDSLYIEPPSEIKAGTESQLEIEGLIIDETRTKIGRDFYDLFYSKWVTPPNAADYTITISEKPMPRLGALVSIQINDMLVFSDFVQPRWDAIEERAELGIERVKSYLENWEMIQNELQGEDMQGTGIF